MRGLMVGVAVALGLCAPDCGALAADSIDTIVVTGLRRPESLATLAGNTAVLSPGEIDFIGAQHPAEALNRLPGVLVHRGSGQEHLTAIRSPVLTAGAGAGSFLYLEDGIPARSAGFANVNGLFELNTELAGGIEVVRGPGSELYGSNAVHGLINVLTRGPTAEPGGFVDFSGGSFGRYEGRLFTSFGTPEDGATIAFVAKHEDGYRAQSGLDQQKLTLRRDRRDGAVYRRFTLSGSNLNQETAGFVVGDGSYKEISLARGNLNPEAYRDARAVRGAAHFEREGGWGLTSFTAYARRTHMEFLQHFLPSKALEENGDWSFGFLADQEFAVGESGKVIAGLDGEYTDGFLKETQFISVAFPPGYPLGVHYDYEIEALVIAPYVHTEWQLTPRLRIDAGARYEVTRYDYHTNTPADVVGRFLRPADRTDTFRALTPKLALSYEVSDDIFAYGRLARGMRAPQTSDAYRLQSLQVVGEIEEEEADSAEIGIRGRIAGASFEAAVYAMDKRHFFFRDADGFNVPDGKTRHLGVELEFAAPLPGRFELDGAWTYAEHTYRFDRPVLSVPTEVISSGNDVDTAPHWLGNLALVWRPTTDVHAELSWSHVGEYFTDAANDHTYPGHDVFDFRAEWNVSERVAVHGAVRNLTNTNYAERADFAFGSGRYFPGETRGFEGGLTLRF